MNADVATSEEDNTNWAKLAAEHRPRERCKTWSEHVDVHSAYNQNLPDKPGTYLPGGVSVWSISEAVGRFGGKGVDASMPRCSEDGATQHYVEGTGSVRESTQPIDPVRLSAYPQSIPNTSHILPVNRTIGHHKQHL